MSIVLPTVATRPLVVKPRKVAAALLNPASIPPTSIMVPFNWASEYGAGTAVPNVNVLVNVTEGGAQIPIDQIRSVKIDNLGNPAPVYVYFLDTTDTIVAPANTIVWEPVVTNAKIANVILQGASDGAGVGQTKVYFCNFFVPPYVNAEINQAVALYKGSPSIQRTNTLQPGYGPPALGDQAANALLDINNSGGLPQSVTILGPAAPVTDTFYITSLNLFMCQVSASYAGGGTASQFGGKIYDATNGQIIYSFRLACLTTALNALILNANGLNFRLSGAHTYNLQIDTATTNTGTFTFWGITLALFIGYTQNPN